MEIDYDNFFTMIIYGAPDSGKSNLIRFLVYNGAIKCKFDHAILFSSSKDDKDYSYIDKKYRFDGYDHNTLKKYIDMQREYNKNGIKSKGLIILDDVMGSENFNKDNSIWLDIFSNYRHIGVNVICSLQAPIAMPSKIRSIIKYACIYKYVNENDRKNIYGNFGSLCKDDTTFYELYDKHTNERFKFLFYNRSNIYESSKAYCGARAPAPNKIPKFVLDY